jgi:hypothetical protein
MKQLKRHQLTARLRFPMTIPWLLIYPCLPNKTMEKNPPVENFTHMDYWNQHAYRHDRRPIWLSHRHYEFYTIILRSFWGVLVLRRAESWPFPIASDHSLQHCIECYRAYTSDKPQPRLLLYFQWGSAKYFFLYSSLLMDSRSVCNLLLCLCLIFWLC